MASATALLLLIQHRNSGGPAIDVLIDDVLTWEIPDPDISETEPQVRALLSEARADVGRNRRSAEAWGRLGQLYDAHALNRQAEHCYRHAAYLAPGDLRWAYHRAFLHDMLQGDAEEVAALFQRAEALNTDYPPLPYRLGDALTRRGLHEEAISAFRRAIDLAPDFAAAHRALGQSCLALGRLDEALRHLDRAVELLPHDSITWATLARLHMRNGDLVLSEHAAQRAQELKPVVGIFDPLRREVTAMSADHLALTQRASERLRKGRYAEAADELRWAVQVGLKNARVHGQLALCYELLGDRRSAIDHLRRAVEIDPDDEVLRGQLEAITESEW